MKLSLKKLKNYINIENFIVLGVFSLFFFIYSKIFINQILTSGDSWYLPLSFIKEYNPSFWYDQYSTGGLYPLTFTQIPIFLTFNILYKIFNIDYGLGSKIIFYFPYLILLIISGFIIPLKISKDKLIASLVFILFSTNTYILSIIIGSTPLIALAYSLMPITLYLITNFIIDKKYYKYQYFLSGFFFGLIIILDVRYAHIFSLFLGLFLILSYVLKKINLNKKELLSFIPLFLGGIIITNLFWILPYLSSGNDFISLPANYDNPDWIKLNTVNDYANLFSMKHAFWPNILDGIKNSVEWYWGLFWILVLLVFLRYKQNSKNFYYLGLFLLSSILYLGSNFILKDFNIFIFSNIPTFQIQRDPFKYFVLIILSLYVLLLNLNIKNTYLKICLIFSLILPVLFTINIDYGLFKNKTVPIDYQKLNSILSEDSSINRTLWIPYKHRYGEFNGNKPSMQYIDFQSYGFLNLSKSQSNIINDKDKFKDLLRVFGIKYIIIPYDPMSEWNDSTFSKMMQKDKYLEKLLDIDSLEHISFSENLHLFINENYEPLINSQQSLFSKINSSKYNIKVTNINSPQKLSFLQSYHNNWKIYINQVDSIAKDCNIIREYNEGGLLIRRWIETFALLEYSRYTR